MAMTRAKVFIEDNMVTMLSNVITEGDKKSQPIQLSMDSMRKFLASYEQLRTCEKRMIADGF